MPRYSEEFKAEVVEKMMPPNSRKVADMHRQTGVSKPILHAWRRESGTGGMRRRRVRRTRNLGVAGASSQWLSRSPR